LFGWGGRNTDSKLVCFYEVKGGTCA